MAENSALQEDVMDAYAKFVERATQIENLHLKQIKLNPYFIFYFFNPLEIAFICSVEIPQHPPTICTP